MRFAAHIEHRAVSAQANKTVSALYCSGLAVPKASEIVTVTVMGVEEDAVLAGVDAVCAGVDAGASLTMLVTTKP